MNIIKFKGYLIIGLFLLTTFIPLLIGLNQKDKLYSKVEKRKLSQLPDFPKQFDSDVIKSYPQKFGDYYSDQFGGRITLIKQYKKLKHFLGDSPSNDITIGKDGWIFLGSIKKPKENHGIINDYRNIDLYTDSQLEKIAYYLEGLRLWLKARNIEYLFFIAPNKHTIYHDKLPSYLQKVSPISAREQLANYINQHTNVHTMDIAKSLFARKKGEQLYYKKDTHWNYIASNYVQFDIFSKLQSIFPSKVSAQIYPMAENIGRGGDLIGIMGPFIYVDDGVPYTKSDPLPIFNNTCDLSYKPEKHKTRDRHTSFCEKNDLSALIYRDSFFTRMEPFFAQQLKSATFLFEKSSYISIRDNIKRIKPNIVIEEWVERHLPYVPRDYHLFFNYLKKAHFKESNNVLFDSDWASLQLTSNIEKITENSEGLEFNSITNDPIIFFPKLAFNPKKAYIVKIHIKPSVNASLQLFYSNSQKSKKKFSQKSSKRVRVKKGEAKIYIYLNDIDLGSYLRLDPINKKGVFTLKSIEIKEVNPLLINK